MKDTKYLKYHYVIQDEDNKKFNIFPLKFWSFQWNDKVGEAKKQNRNVSGYTVENEKAQDTHNWLISIGYSYSEELLIEKAYDNTNEYNKKLPAYAQEANLNRVLIINCHYCNAPYGELIGVDYPGEEVLKNSKHNEYKAKCLKCKKEVNDAYNWYR